MTDQSPADPAEIDLEDFRARLRANPANIHAADFCNLADAVETLREQLGEAIAMSAWQDISTPPGPPKDGTKFLALHGETVFCAFYRRNPNHTVRRPVTLQVIMNNNQYSAAGTWFIPTHWMPFDPPKDAAP